MKKKEHVDLGSVIFYYFWIKLLAIKTFICMHVFIFFIKLCMILFLIKNLKLNNNEISNN